MSVVLCALVVLRAMIVASAGAVVSDNFMSIGGVVGKTAHTSTGQRYIGAW